VAEWLAGIQAAAANPGAASSSASPTRAQDWLLALIAQITGEAHPGIGDELRLSEDLGLDSLGRVQLAAALEERLGILSGSEMLDQVQTLGELRHLLAGNAEGVRAAWNPTLSAEERGKSGAPNLGGERTAAGALSGTADGVRSESENEAAPAKFIYPHWPWLKPFGWLRAAFVEAVLRPLVWLLADPEVMDHPAWPASDEPMLIIANHVTTFDGPLIQYALARPLRRRLAVAMSGEMLEDFRHFRNPERGPGQKGFYLPGPLIYLLLTALFNVFPLPRQRGFQRSFAHAGEALDRGFNVLVFPEGTRSAEGALARFRPGIGLLARQSGAMVLPVAIRGLGELKSRRRGWFRSGTIEVLVGQPIRFSPIESEAAIAARLHDEVEMLLNG
jgi:long-chain acyl-CoA synthetase